MAAQGGGGSTEVELFARSCRRSAWRPVREAETCEVLAHDDRVGEPRDEASEARGASGMTMVGTGPYTADIGDETETFETLADIQRAMRARVSGTGSSSECRRQMRSPHGAKVRDAAGKVVANVWYNARLLTRKRLQCSGVCGRRIKISWGSSARDAHAITSCCADG